MQLVHGYRSAEDREVAAYLAAVLAFGRVGSLLPKARSLLEALGPRPARSLREGRPRPPRGWVHRWIDAGDMAWLRATSKGRIKTLASGVEATETFNTVVIFRRTAAGWKIRCYMYNASKGSGTPQ